ncbi:winged helix-turn-helix transcriptional regulator [Rhodobacter sp. SY28-1]|uniref:winged helix-turn-helix transcriptional regulator n=1 Tax=Rhodobacter sp. SY28-1 TaxID=2562317 RepID=UPI001485058F|nr:winged helix-turn-helix transcriptional regulator [Rhodobacter sp. SY28-1]
MPSKPYGTICALSKACEIIEPRWTLLILNQMWCGYTRFSDIRRAVGNISPGVLSKRLSEMEKVGLIERIEDRAKGSIDYIRTQMAIELEPAMDAISIWAQRHIDAEVALSNTNLSNMMWKFGKAIKPAHLPARRVVIRLHFADKAEPYPTWWLVADPATPPEVCSVIPDVDVDLFVETTKMSWSALLLGRSTVAREIDSGRLFMTGDPVLMRTINNWLPRSDYAQTDGIRMLPAAERVAKTDGQQKVSC